MSITVHEPSYEDFLRAKVAQFGEAGIAAIMPEDLHPVLKPHQRDAVSWMLRKGRAALFAGFGMGKTLMQIEAMRQLIERGEIKYGLIVLPLGVRQEFTRDDGMLDLDLPFIRTTAEIAGPGIYLTNYESVREGKIDVSLFDAVSLDEAAILRGFGGSKTFRELMRQFEGTRFRFVATATPSPNEYIELLSYAAFLGVMEVGEAKTRFFKRNSSNADKLTLHPHKEREFWCWVASWALFLTRPSDLGHSDEGYDLPPLDVRWHEVPSDHSKAGAERDGQGRMFRNAAIGVSDAAAEKRATLGTRIAKMIELRDENPGAHRILWHDLEDERRAIEAAIPGVMSVYGSQDLETREANIIGFSDGLFAELAGKPSVTGVGCNFQRHCAWSIFLGIGFKFYDMIQACHRVHRFGQTQPVRVDFIYSEAEREVRRAIETKWARHDEQVEIMRGIVREYGLNRLAMAQSLQREMHVPREEAAGDAWRLINNDTVIETAAMDEASVGLIVTSIPFATQYEYTPNYCYDESTEVLSDRGWISFGEVGLIDKLATVDQSLLSLEWQHPIATVWEHYSGDMLHFVNSNNFDLLVTPDHGMFVDRRVGNQETGRKDRRYGKVRASEIADNFVSRKYRMVNAIRYLPIGKNPKRIEVLPAARGARGPVGKELGSIAVEDFMELAGWYLSEGYCDALGGPHAGRITISQSLVHPKYRDEICALFNRIGLTVQINAKAIIAHNRALARLLVSEFGSGSYHKSIPAWVKELDGTLLLILRDTMMKGDGGARGFDYASVSPKLRDDFQHIAFLTGWGTAIRGNVVRIGRSQVFPEIRRAPDLLAYSGMIGCAKVPNGTLVVRRNGVISISGNCDFGHTDDNDHFWRQMDYLTPNLLRVLHPGRVMAVHVKDRIMPGGLSGLGFQTLHPFHCEAIEHYRRHGFALLGMKTITTDVVRENNQTYRLGWSEQCKDGSRMGCGVPEYLLLLRRPPTDASSGYADDRVVKEKPLCFLDDDTTAPFDKRTNWKRPAPGTGYSRAAWQIDAHGYARSSGDRLLSGDDLRSLPHEQMFKWWRARSTDRVYDYREHLGISEDLDALQRLPATFMLFPPHSPHPDVWTDVARMRTLNGEQVQKGREVHLCPLQFDIVDRLIVQFSNPGDVVYDPFAGIGTVPLRAVKLGRQGLGTELSRSYWRDAVAYCRAEDEKRATPTLFDILDAPGMEAAE